MKRFNLLLISPDVSLSQPALKGLSKMFKNNFVFEATSLAEGQRLLERLQIDLLLVDTHAKGVDMEELVRTYPKIRVMGLVNGAGNAQDESASLRMLPKNDLTDALANELKSLRKSGAITLKVAEQQLSSTPDFKDYSRLTSSEFNPN